MLRFATILTGPAMSFYAIGDIQGCHAEFCQLLDLIGFSPREDRLWIVAIS